MAVFGSAFRSLPHTPAHMMSASSVCHYLRFNNWQAPAVATGGSELQCAERPDRGVAVDTTQEGGVLGTLAWLGIDLPSPSAPTPHTIGVRWAEIWNADQSLAVIDEIVAPTFVSHSAPPGLPPGREGVRMWASAFRSAFPNLWSKVEDVIVEGDRVVERFQRRWDTRRASCLASHQQA